MSETSTIERDSSPAKAKGKGRHLALLEDMAAHAQGRRPKWRLLWERRLGWPSCLTGGKSWNMAMMALVNRLQDALNSGERVVVAECVDDCIAMCLHARRSGMHGPEFFGHYSTWNTAADCYLAILAREAAPVHPGGVDHMANHLETLLAMWRVMSLPIVAKAEQGRVRYRGRGTRNAGGRELPKNQLDGWTGLADAFLASLEGAGPDVVRGQGPEHDIYHALPLHDLGHRMHLLNATAAKAEAIAKRRGTTAQPYIVERYHDGSVGTFLLRGMSSETASLMGALASGDGEGYHCSFPYPDERVRKSWAKNRGGSLMDARGEFFGEGQGRRFRSTNGLDGKWYELEIPPESEIDWTCRWGVSS